MSDLRVQLDKVVRHAENIAAEMAHLRLENAMLRDTCRKQLAKIMELQKERFDAQSR